MKLQAETEFDVRAEGRSPPGQWRLFSTALVAWPLTCFMILQPGRGILFALGFGTIGCLMLILFWSARAFGHRQFEQGVANAVSLLAVCCAVVMLLGTQVHRIEQQRADIEFRLSSDRGEAVSFLAQLVGFQESRGNSFESRAWVRVDALRPGGPVPMLVWLTDEISLPAHAGPGTLVQITAKLQETPPSDQAAYLAQPVALSVTALSASQAKNLAAKTPREKASSITSRASPVFAGLGSAAAHFRTLLVQNATAVPGAELVPGLAVGDTSLVSESLDAAMLESSLTHIVAVSGSNTGLVVAVVVWCASRIGCGRRTRVCIAAIGLLLFVIVVGPDASVQRASVMAVVLLVSGFGGKRAKSLPALGLAVITLLVADPWQALQAGFALSVAATAGILLCATPIASWLGRRARLPRVFALPFAIALAAQLSCGPMLLLLQPGIPAIGVIANVVAAPAVPLGTGLGLIAAILGPLSPEIAQLAIQVARIPALWISATAEVCAHLPAGRWNWPQGWPGALLLATCESLLFIGLALRSGRLGVPRFGRVAPRAPWQLPLPVPLPLRVIATLTTASAVSIFLAVTLVVPISSRIAVPKNWQLVACDVGQGDALIARDIRHPNEVMLIDTGDDAESLLECLSLFQVQRISLLVLTHDDRDHVGALDAVIGRVDETLIAPTVTGENTEERQIVRSLAASGVPYRIAYAGESGDIEYGLRWQVLAPAAKSIATDTNAASIVMLLEFGNHRALMLGDTGYDEQLALRAMLEIQNVSVVKIAHHGSRDQDHRIFSLVNAQWGLISVGQGNRYGHPNSETVSAAQRAGMRTLRTDHLGSIAIVLHTDGNLGAWVEGKSSMTPSG